MRTYSLELLRTPEIYQLDTELASLARKLANENYERMGAGRMGFGELKQQFLSGQHAELVFERLNAEHAAEMAAKTERKRLLGLVEALSLPAGVTVTVDGDSLKIKAPYDGGDLNRRLNKKGGHWDGYNRCIVAPLPAVESLPKILSNWAKAQGIVQQAKAEAEAKAQAERQQERQRREAERQLLRQQRSEEGRKIEEAERQRRAKAVASRVQVTVGQYQVGDLLNGRVITGFGKSWTEATLKAGQLYQPCAEWRCDGEPVCVNCERCARHCGCDTMTVCYAYFE